MIVILAILVTTGLFLLLAVVLLVAERKLANYGTCHVIVNDGETEFDTEGGGTLLATLAENKIFIPSACAGKGSCGYCKVTVNSGGGQVLPTETPYLSRSEIRTNTRLACQVKVKSNISIRIPDFLETVRSMVVNKTFNAALKWKWSTTPDKEIETDPMEIDMPPEQAEALDQIIALHREKEDAIIPILQQVNADFGYLPEPVLRRLADLLELPITRVYALSTFYNAFSLTPKGRFIIRVCMGTACHVKGAGDILNNLEQTLGIPSGGTTPDGNFSIEEVRCLGCCALAPVIMINEDVHGKVTQARLPKILEQYMNRENASDKVAVGGAYHG